jgi:uncharacterized damage-inducible protein DinB
MIFVVTYIHYVLNVIAPCPHSSQQKLAIMKRLLLLLPILFFFAFSVNVDGISKKEKKAAMSYLEETRDDLLTTLKGLSEDQFNFKPAGDRWSIKECLQHIAITEDRLWQWTDGVIKAAPNPDKRAEIKVNDDQVMKMISDRSNKVKTSADMEPQTSQYTTALDALNAFKTSRERLIKYVKNSKDDLRNHVTDTPIGAVDAYQLILFIGAHSNRHTQQIAEVMADPNFPK